MPIRVVLAEDNLLVRQGVRSLLELEEEIEVVDAVGDLDALFAAVAEHEPDVLVTDIRMPPTGKDEGVVAATRLRQTQPHLGVVVLSQYDEPEYALALLAGGSERRAYLLKERVSDPEQLVGTIRAVASGGSYIDPKVVEALIAARSRSVTLPAPTHALLTPPRNQPKLVWLIVPAREAFAAGDHPPGAGRRHRIRRAHAECGATFCSDWRCLSQYFQPSLSTR